MINGSHVVIYSREAEADRAFFRDVLKLPNVDAGEGWLIFALPPAEMAFHPAEENNVHELFLTCEDLKATLKELDGLGVRYKELSEQSWGITTKIKLPGGGSIGLYQPRHARPKSFAR